MPRAALLALSALLLLGCESVQGEPAPMGLAAFENDPRLGEPVRQICFASQIDGFSMTERRTVLLHDGRKRYMVELYGPCPDLAYSNAIGLVTPSACLTRGDAILVTSTSGPAGPRPGRCTIKEIRDWDPRAEADEETENLPET
ncbi:MAG: DUF6491 family protein [Hyphomonas sp.]